MTGPAGMSLSSRSGLLAAVAAVGMTLGAASAELADVAEPWSDPTGYAQRCLAVGATVNGPGRVDGPDLAMFREADASLGPLTVRRSFDSSLPSDFDASSAGGDARAGVRSFVSWKPPGGDYRGAAAGRYDEEITAWARSVPRTGVYATSFHEPENDMTAEEFVALQRRLYVVVKAANPSIRWGPVYMAYWWDPTLPAHWVGDPDAWWPGSGYADFAGLDWYGANPGPMTTSRSFRTWYEAMEPRGLPLLITEYGQYVLREGERSDRLKERARAAAIAADAAWIADHPQIRMWLYWQGVGPRGDWRIRDEAGRDAWRAVAATGCRRHGDSQ